MNYKPSIPILKKLFFILMLLVFTACTINEPVLPSWITIWELPIPNISFEMSDAIDDEFIYADTTTGGIPILAISLNDTLDKQGISKKDLSIKPDPDTLSKSLEDILITSPGTRSTNPYSVSDILPFAIQTGDTIDVPEITPAMPTQSVVFSSYQYVDVRDGGFLIIFHNNTFLNIKEGMEIEIYDDSTGFPFGQKIGTATFPAIGPYSSAPANDSLDLSDNILSHKLRLDAQIPIQADTGHVVTNQDINGYVNIELTMSDLMVREALAEIPEQLIIESGAKSIIEEKSRIKEGTINEGKIVYFVENQMAVDASVVITLPNFEKNGTMFSYSDFIPQNSINSAILNISGYKMINHISPMTIIDSIQYDVEIQTVPSAGMVHISEGDSVIVHFIADTIFFDDLDGVVDTVQVEIDTIKQEDIFDYNGFEGGIRFEDLEMEITMFNEIGLPIDIAMNVLGERRDDETGQIEATQSLDPIQVHLDPGASGSPSTSIINLNSANSKIVDLMEILPTDISMNGISTVQGEGRLTLSDSIWGEYRIYSPMNVYIDSIPPYESEVELMDSLDSDIQQAIEDNFREGTLKFDVVNGLPFSADVILIFSTDTTDFFVLDTTDTSKLIIDDIHFESANIGTNGYAAEPSFETIEFKLNENEINIFAKDNLYMGSKLIFPESNKGIKFRSTDNLSADGAVRLRVLMNEN